MNWYIKLASFTPYRKGLEYSDIGHDYQDIAGKQQVEQFLYVIRPSGEVEVKKATAEGAHDSMFNENGIIAKGRYEKKKNSPFARVSVYMVRQQDSLIGKSALKNKVENILRSRFGDDIQIFEFGE